MWFRAKRLPKTNMTRNLYFRCWKTQLEQAYFLRCSLDVVTMAIMANRQLFQNWKDKQIVQNLNEENYFQKTFL